MQVDKTSLSMRITNDKTASQLSHAITFNRGFIIQWLLGLWGQKSKGIQYTPTLLISDCSMIG